MISLKNRGHHLDQSSHNFLSTRTNDRDRLPAVLPARKPDRLRAAFDGGLGDGSEGEMDFQGRPQGNVLRYV
ncbi:hypothetical protein ABIB56_003315 [Glaciihabitans sp. UYNi722]